MNAGSKRIKAFLRLADEELQAARLLVQEAPRQASYFCQQCAEKIARAFLTDAGVPFGTGHNLGQMAMALPPGHLWIEKIRGLDRHSSAATRYRYPAPTGRLFDPPDTEQIELDIGELTALLEEAKKCLHKHLNSG
jgi:hypothetical protein